MSENKGSKKYIDSKSRVFTSMPKLCKVNGIDYGKFYRLVKIHGMSTKEACDTLLEAKAKAKENSAPSYLDKTDKSTFKPKSKLPSKAYEEYLKYDLNRIRNSVVPFEIIRGMSAIMKGIENELAEIRSNRYSFDVFDRWCLGEDVLNENDTMIRHMLKVSDSASLERNILEFAYNNELLDKTKLEERKKKVLKGSDISPDVKQTDIKDIKGAKTPAADKDSKDSKGGKANKSDKADRKDWSIRGTYKNDIDKADEMALREILDEIAITKEHLSSLQEKKRILIRDIEEKNVKDLPFTPSHKNSGAFCGLYYKSIRRGDIYLYWNNEEKTYYRKPLYRVNGTLIGSVSFENEIKRKIEYDLKGYKDVTDKA